MNGNLIAAFREKKRISQRQLADLLGISRTRLQRMEQSAWQRLSLGDLDSLASALSMPLAELLQQFSFAAAQTEIFRGSFAAPIYQTQVTGARFISALPKQSGSLVGRLVLEPKAVFAAELLESASGVSGFVEKGEILICSLGRQWVVRADESFKIPPGWMIEFSNPHQILRASVAVFSGEGEKINAVPRSSRFSRPVLL